ncbi:Tim17/Tim22/Tim23/Pmp24 family-domain-containing protein [Halteromyces radiatus]|uniref:Tim17/Tim22/Tim23/Pmp24 family-domain-containing protein n=1 Tax=Halteromyces radiatus TaxID=101107 RepID=UPI0022201472|nr:Tim17/Tim22/Tim23/Pmp24 family-domain-containing protein [Halteromyces radiatus]KAI8086347.1 Tim17/Tim22/Tim23/Pmp24 family-domain-containing protein [Halteromyces radiatus]
MGIFGFGSSNNDSTTISNETLSQDADDLYSPSGNSGFESSTESFGENSYEKMPDFMSSLQYDSSKLQPMALQGGIDFLQIDNATDSTSYGGGALTPSRGWTDDLCYGTGTAYLAGLTLGGAFGLAEGLKKSSTTSTNMKVRLNTTLNTITRRGPGLGNSVGVIAMMYNGTTAMIDASRGTHDIFNSIAGGAISGAIFKCTAGPRVMAMSSGACATVAGVWSLLSKAFTD